MFVQSMKPMELIFTEHPFLASAIAAFVFLLAGTVDLIVLKYRVIAILFWVLGFLLTMSPLFGMKFAEVSDSLLIIAIGCIYVFLVRKIYVALSKSPGSINLET